MLHEVLTTEKVPFTYRVAGLGSRFLAYLLDAGFLVLLVFMGLVLANVLEAGRGGAGAALLALWTFALIWGYFPLFEWLWQGQTPGKRLLGIRVVQWQGTSVTFFAAAVRNLLRALDWLPLLLLDRVPVLLAALGPLVLHGISFTVAAANPRHRRPGDFAAGTLVVHVERRAQPIRALHEGTPDGDAIAPAVRQRLAQLEREQKQTLLDLCLRREQLRAGERARLFRATSDYLQKRLDIAPGPYQSDEKFVLQLVAALGEGAEGTARS
jgi:uncharacterized RDD family membrane protein YckC